MSAADLGYETEYMDEKEESQALQIVEPVANPYIGMSVARFSVDQAAILTRPLTPTEVKLRPDGIVYFPEIYYRRRLNEAFGPGGWALQVARLAQDGKTVIAHCRLYVEGRFVSEAIGEADFIPNNDSYTYATAAESAKSNGLMRTCKDLGIASELWDPDFIKDWQAHYAVEVWCTNIGSGPAAGKKKKLWRLKSAPPIDQFPWREGDGGSREQPAKAPANKPAGKPETVSGKIDAAMAEKLRKVVKDRNMPPATATGIFKMFGFELSTDVTVEKFNDVMTALCGWKAAEVVSPGEDGAPSLEAQQRIKAQELMDAVTDAGYKGNLHARMEAETGKRKLASIPGDQLPVWIAWLEMELSGLRGKKS